MLRRPPRSTLFPYTTLFRSVGFLPLIANERVVHVHFCTGFLTLQALDTPVYAFDLTFPVPVMVRLVPVHDHCSLVHATIHQHAVIVVGKQIAGAGDGACTTEEAEFHRRVSPCLVGDRQSLT